MDPAPVNRIMSGLYPNCYLNVARDGVEIETYVTQLFPWLLSNSMVLSIYTWHPFFTDLYTALCSARQHQIQRLRYRKITSRYPTLSMDPLSLTLAAVSLTSTAKALIEYGRKIHRSFTKVSNSLRSAQRVAEEIKEMVEEICIFYEDHENMLADMNDFHLALQGLVDKFSDFDKSILPLLPPTGGRRRDRLIRGWDAWRNRDKIEECILDLQSDISKLMRRYMMKSTMRTEVKLEAIHQETSQSYTGISQGLEVLEIVQRDISTLCSTTAAIATIHRPYSLSGASDNDFDRNVIMFAKSTPSASTPILRTPEVITEELMTAAYIRLQVKHIITTLETISKAPATMPSIVNDFLISPISMQKSMRISRLRHHVIRQIIDIRDLLDTKRDQAVSIHEGARALNNLSVDLGSLHMGHEAVQLGKWAMLLARALVDTSGGDNPDLCAAFAFYLSNQAVHYYNNGDKIRSLQASEESYAITQNLRRQYNGQVRFEILYSEVLLQYAQLVDTQRSIEMLVEAVQALENIFGVQGFTQSHSHVTIDSIQRSSSSFLDHLFSSPLPIIAISNYALALQRLGIYLSQAGHPKNAVDMQLLAIGIRRKIVLIYGNNYKADLANALSSLVQADNARSRIPAGELIKMTEECIHLLRELAESNPLSYARKLTHVLWSKAKTLETLERDAEAIATWEEVVSLAGQFVEDSILSAAASTSLAGQCRRLKRYNDAARIMLAIAPCQHGSDLQAMRYTLLSTDLGRLRRYKESAEAARTAVGLYRQAAMKNPERWTSTLADGLSDLSYCLAASGQCSEALIAWKNSVDILENFLNTTLDASSALNDSFITSLRTHTVIGYFLDDEEGSLKISSTAARYFRRLSEMCCSQNSGVFVNLMSAEFCHAYNLVRVGRLQNGLEYINEWLDMWKVKLEGASDAETVRWHAAMIACKVNILDAQGLSGEAVLATQRICDIVRPFVSTYQPSFAAMIKAMIHNARLQMDLGNNEEALQIAEEALQLSRDRGNSNLDLNDRRPIVRSLHGVAFTALICRNYQRATEVAREGCGICATTAWLDGESEHNTLLRPSLFAILSYAEANLRNMVAALGHARRAVEISLDIRDMKLLVSSTIAQQSYVETRGNLADILLAAGDLAQARRISQERRVYFSERVEKRMGEYRDLAPILRMLGVLYCSEGCHEEGHSAAQELSHIMKMLGNVFPSLGEQVKRRLQKQARIPILKVLNNMYQKLDCGHQTEVVTLFEF